MTSLPDHDPTQVPSGSQSRFQRSSQRANVARDEAISKWTLLCETNEIAGYANSLYERNRSAHASVLGSAVALRLFLFLVPATVAISSLVELLPVREAIEQHMVSNVATGEVALAVTSADGWRVLSLLLSGIALTLMAGYSLTKVLVASTASSWRMPDNEVKTRVITVAALTGILFSSVAASAVLGVLRDHAGFVGASAVWLSIMAIAAAAWFVVSVTLPRGVTDPGSVLPGALLFGVANTVLQAVMHVYLPGKISRTTDTFGGMAATVAILGNYFFVGRIMTSSFLLNAVTYEQFGSISQLFFGLPGLRRLPRRYDRLANYFSLDVEQPAGNDTDQHITPDRGEE